MKDSQKLMEELLNCQGMPKSSLNSLPIRYSRHEINNHFFEKSLQKLFLRKITECKSFPFC